MNGSLAASVTEGIGLPAEDLQVAPARDVFGSPFRVADAALASVGAAVAAVAAFQAARTGRSGRAVVDGRHAAVAFHSERLLSLPSHGAVDLWDPIAGNYATADGWIRLHTNLRHHRDAVVGLLGVEPDREAVAAAVASWSAEELEGAVADAGGVAGRMRTREEYARHPQHEAVRGGPLVDIRTEPEAGGRDLGAGQVLDGIRVLDLSRVIAGPVAGRFLAAFGADVVRVDPPLDDGLVTEVDTGFGKRRTSIDLGTPEGRDRFSTLVAGADVLVEGFRPGALADTGFGDQRLRELAPGLTIGHLSAYSDRGPWATRRGFDSVVQVATGLAHACGFDATAGPSQLPAQALDHASGYLLAAGVIAGLTKRCQDGKARTVRVSLARTGEWLADLGRQDAPQRSPARESVADLMDAWPDTAWGPVEHVRPVGCVGDQPARWARPPVPRTDAPVTWLDAVST